ncbi:hypothetical protein FRX31_034516 [Thalictrum thalictroides]|uniref:Uncharacterized protein n=1 Tax=Thalictrum thalictroides TaxID=46969 RepID=A0A7J6UTK7_THATH|nr:hypothetical protein FRX31_034516 [Thalictrum thalictroides]
MHYLSLLCRTLGVQWLHLFILCPTAKAIWEQLTGHLQMHQQVLNFTNVEGVLLNWPDLRSREIGADIWSILPAAVLWTLWTTRNGIIFKEEQMVVDKVVKRIQFTVWSWLDIWERGSELKKNHSSAELLQHWETLMNHQW